MLSEIRIGKFTSSQIYKLMAVLKNGKPSTTKTTYIEEVGIEKRLGRTLNSASSARPLAWGKALEPRVAAILGEFEYDYCSDQTIVHPTIPTWAGTPDLIGKETVADIKCPYTLKSFVQLSDICLAGDVEALKTDFPMYYWQLVSNAVLTGKKLAELIVYCPYLSELQAIREAVNELDSEVEQTKLQWIAFNPDEDLPYIPDGGHYKNLNRFTFKVTDEDIAQLTNEVLLASLEIK